MIKRTLAHIHSQLLIIAGELLAWRMVLAVPERRTNRRLTDFEWTNAAFFRGWVHVAAGCDAVGYFGLALAPAAASHSLIVDDAHFDCNVICEKSNVKPVWKEYVCKV